MAKNISSKVEGVVMKSLPVVAGVMIVGLAIRYGGDLPVIEDVKKGLNGDVKGNLFG